MIAVVSEAKTGFHIRLVSRGRWEFPELKRQAVALAEIWRPHAVLIEDAAPGQSLVQALKAETQLPILPVCGELLILAENTSVAQSCESFTSR